MTIWFIYKQFIDEATGNISNIEFIECDNNETNAASFTKLYNLQIPYDLRNKISYQFIAGRVQ